MRVVRVRPAVEGLEGRVAPAAGLLAAASAHAQAAAISAAALKPTVTAVTALPGAGVVRLTATVRPQPGLAAVRSPTGVVVFVIDGQAQPPTVLVRQAGRSVAVTNTAGLTPGAHTVAAYYPGDGLFAASASPPVRVVVPAPALAPTTTTAAVLTVPASAGRPVSFSATVTATGTSAATPTGGVVFSVDGQDKDLVPLVTTAGSPPTAAITIPGLPLGYHTVSATYTGDARFAVSTAPLATFLVQSLDLVPTATVLTAAPNPVAPGATLTLTAAINPINSTTMSPTGGVVFTVDGVAQPVVPIQYDAFGAASATFSTSGLATGIHRVSAAYPGDPRFGDSTSDTVVVVVGNSAAHTVRLGLTASPASPAAGKPVVFTATVAPLTGAGAVPTGNATLILDGRAFSIVPLTPAGTASSARARFTVVLSGGLHRLAVVYAGDTTYLPASTINSPLTIVARG